MYERVARRTMFVGLGIGVLAAAACGGDSTGRGRTVVISTAGDADVLFPPTLRFGQAQEVSDLLFDKLADLGPALNTIGDAGYEPRLAERWEWAPDSMSVTFHLDPDAKWHDGTPVRAGDVDFAFDVYTDARVGSSKGAEIRSVVDSISVVDSLTCTAWFKVPGPERFHTLTYNLHPLPKHLLDSVPRDSLPRSAFTLAPVGSGPFRFVRWEPKQRIEIEAVDDFYRGPPEIDRVIWAIVSDGAVAAQRVLTGEADFISRLTNEEVSQAEATGEVRPVPVGDNQYTFLVFNLRVGHSPTPHPVLGNREIRRALTRALDKPAMVSNLLDSLGRVALGPFTRMQWSADTTLTQLTFDRAAAERSLDSLGWTKGSDGVRARSGTPLAFTILIPGSSALRQRLAVLMQEQWRQIGAQVSIENVDFTAMNERNATGNFDAVITALTTGPSPSGIRQSWSSAALTMPSGFNIGGYRNSAVDAAIDSALGAHSIDEARRHYRTAYQTLIDDAPAIWIYEPIIRGGANRRLELAPMRADAWWTSIPRWRVSD